MVGMAKDDPNDKSDLRAGSRDTVNPVADALRLLQDVSGRLTDAARSLADQALDSPAGPYVEPLARMGAQVAELSTAWVGPVKALLDEQQELIEALAAWSEQQRIIAERFSALAERNRAISAQTMAVLGPLLDGVESVGQFARPADKRTKGPDRAE
jgi:hypothetical protein